MLRKEFLAGAIREELEKAGGTVRDRAQRPSYEISHRETRPIELEVSLFGEV